MKALNHDMMMALVGWGERGRGEKRVKNNSRNGTC